MAHSAGPSKLTASTRPLEFPGLEAASTILAIVREVGEMLRNVPYVRSISGIILQIITIKEVRSQYSFNKYTAR